MVSVTLRQHFSLDTHDDPIPVRPSFWQLILPGAFFVL
jgi:hypothetical protein